MVKNPNWWEADQLVIYKHDLVVGQGRSNRLNSSLMVREVFEPVTPIFLVRFPNHSATLQLIVFYHLISGRAWNKRGDVFIICHVLS